MTAGWRSTPRTSKRPGGRTSAPPAASTSSRSTRRPTWSRSAGTTTRTSGCPARSRPTSAASPRRLPRGSSGTWRCTPASARPRTPTSRYRYLIEHGSTGGVSIALDLPTQIGLDSRPPDGARRGRPERRRAHLVRRCRADVRRHPARQGRPHLHDRQLHRPDRRGLVPRARREAGRPDRRLRRADPERPDQGVHRARNPVPADRGRRCGWPPTWSRTSTRSRRPGCRSASRART